eukprot:CAMPEP_0119405518 /NCGR_PEP_ID=MMETSP1335-20130426/50_1 /TAXON_ID=259385 /ORGANISM="Chrysoculter rhomboideus, Strain RCC1486" /LENGTH=50 /DNA_ID=CAMNT_0007429503 /DNA_START=76 /DNA_END=225 /DNA_ORIENTATION=+
MINERLPSLAVEPGSIGEKAERSMIVVVVVLRAAMPCGSQAASARPSRTE